MPRMGGPSLMRGYMPTLNRDHDLAALQVEYRLPLPWRFGAVGFAGAGAIGHRLGQLGLDDVRFSYGAGLRFAIDPRERLNLRADFGVGRNGFLHVSDVEYQYYKHLVKDKASNGPKSRFNDRSPRNKPPIQEIFKRGSEVLVQVIKEGSAREGAAKEGSTAG